MGKREEAMKEVEVAALKLLEIAVQMPRPFERARQEQIKHFASSLQRSAIDLCMSKATEYSPAIGPRFVVAAKLALVAFPPGSPEIERYERDVNLDSEHPGDQAKIADYLAYKAQIAAGKLHIPSKG